MEWILPAARGVNSYAPPEAIYSGAIDNQAEKLSNQSYEEEKE